MTLARRRPRPRGSPARRTATVESLDGREGRARRPGDRGPERLRRDLGAERPRARCSGSRTARSRSRSTSRRGKPYNLWSGAGSMWAIDDGSGEVIRIDPKTNEVTTKIQVGDGPADMVFDGTTALRDQPPRPHARRARHRAPTGRASSPRSAATNAAPERMALLDGALWITGRGMDLLKVDPRDRQDARDGRDRRQRDRRRRRRRRAVGARAAARRADQSGFPTMEALRARQRTDGEVTTVSEPTRPRRRPRARPPTTPACG